MTKAEAIELRDKILILCKSRNQWVVITEEQKPELKMIRLEVSLKIDGK